ncbi:MAG: hypothetical protein HY791_08990 [Deltaproteobacteria bacterium]|nr:hypothetical protein [Deltaproteobacteria bacterium]
MSIGLALFLATVGAPTCYELSSTGQAWSRTPETLCVESGEGARHTLVLKTGMLDATRTIATLDLDLISRARCIDCVQDRFAIANPTNSVFNTLAVEIDGKRDMKTGVLTGSIKLGKNKLFFRTAPMAMNAPSAPDPKVVPSTPPAPPSPPQPK